MSAGRLAIPDQPCQQCGACCAAYRVSFYWSEAAALPPTHVEQLGQLMACMAGTNRAAPRCLALEGTIGEAVGCAIYAQRPSPCQELQPGDDKCKRARIRHGLPPLNAV